MCMHEFVVKSFISLLVRVVALLRYSQYILFAPAVGLFCGPLFRMWEKMLPLAQILLASIRIWLAFLVSVAFPSLEL